MKTRYWSVKIVTTVFVVSMLTRLVAVTIADYSPTFA